LTFDLESHLHTFSILAIYFERFDLATSFSVGDTSSEYLGHGSISRSWVQGQGHSSVKVDGLISRSRSQNSGSVQLCAPLGHDLILCLWSVQAAKVDGATASSCSSDSSTGIRDWLRMHCPELVMEGLLTSISFRICSLFCKKKVLGNWLPSIQQLTALVECGLNM